MRVVDVGTASPVRSQAVYHGLAYARTETTPDTIVIARPAAPYVCIGFHQDLEHEIDLEYCRERDLPVLRRETGGGAVYIDSDQLFVQWVMSPASLPLRIDRRYELFIGPLIATYRAFGVDAHFQPVNDVHVGRRKITGTGAAQIGNAEVLVGNFILDFEPETCARTLRSPSKAFRDQLGGSLREYMTSMRRELGAAPDASVIAERYRAECESALGTRLEEGAFTADEIESIEAVERRFESERFRRQPGGLRRKGVKIHANVYVVESVRAAAGGDVRVTARLHHDRIEDVALTGNPLPAAYQSAHAAAGLRGEPWERALERIGPNREELDP